MLTVNQVLDRAREWAKLGCKEGGRDHAKILDIYNNHKPLARNYKVKPTDHWCMTFISVLFIQTMGTSYIGGTECSCERAIEKMKKIGIWNEDGSIVPKAGDIIMYDWAGTNVQSNNGWADHVGIVERVSGNTITIIEGNFKDQVERRVIKVGNKYVRGYARPKYDIVENGLKSLDLIAKEVMNGQWGNNPERAIKLELAGYDPAEIQKRVNALAKG